MSAPMWFFSVVSFLFGICVGSFLNVVIYRLPRNKSLLEPKQSFCPTCNRTLTGVDLVPLFSFLALGRKCRGCKQPISWRYFTVELLTGALWVAIYLRYAQESANAVALMLFTAVLIPIYYIDFDTFTIPTSLNLLAFVIPVGRDIWGIVHHEADHSLLWGWMPRSILGAIVGTLVFGTVRVLGWLWKRQEAMGLGDPLLARGMGAMLASLVPAGKNPLWLMPIWVSLACISGVIIGVALIKIRESKAPSVPTSLPDGAIEAEANELAPDDSNLVRELLDIGYCLVLGDAVEYLVYLFKGNPEGQAPPEEEMDFGPMAPTAIPFGPFLVIGFLAAVFCGNWLTSAYLAYAHLKS